MESDIWFQFFASDLHPPSFWLLSYGISATYQYIFMFGWVIKSLTFPVRQLLLNKFSFFSEEKKILVNLFTHGSHKLHPRIPLLTNNENDYCPVCNEWNFSSLTFTDLFLNEWSSKGNKVLLNLLRPYISWWV